MLFVGSFGFALPEARATMTMGQERRSLIDAFSRAGARLQAHGSWFLQDGDIRPIVLKPLKKRCLSLVLLVSRSQKASLRLADEPPSKERNTRSGLAVVRRCGTRTLRLHRGAIVRMRSMRGAVDWLQFEHDAHSFDWRRALPTRQGGGSQGEQVQSRPPRVPSAASRIQAALEVAKQGGAAGHRTVPGLANQQGRGGLLLHLEQGCHRLTVVAAATEKQGRRIDVDAELRSKDGRRLLAEDHGQAPDALLSFCVASKKRWALRFTGAAPNGKVVVLQSSWPWPFVPKKHWNQKVQSRLAWAFHRDGLRRLPGPLFARYVGVSGDTMLPIEVQPGRCYVAAATANRGQSVALRLRAELEGARYVSAASGGQAAVVLSFCAQKKRLASLRVRQVGRGAGWLLHLWQSSEALQ